MKASGIEESRLREAVQAMTGPAWLADFRQENLDRYLDAGFPTVRQEDWKYTNLAPVADLSGTWLGETAKHEGAVDDQVYRQARQMADGLDAHSILFVDGRLDPASLPDTLPEGIRVEPLLDTRLPAQGPASASPDAMTALNGALLTDGLRLTLEDTCVLDKPLYLVFIATNETSGIVCPRILILAGAHAQATIVEHFAGLRDTQRFTNVVTEIVQHEASRIQHYRLQEQPRSSFQVSRLHAVLASRARLDCQTLDLGGRLVRHDTLIRLAGRGAKASLNGIYLPDTEQHIDNHTRVDHESPDTISTEDYRGVLKGRSRAVFNGKVVVHKGADGTDARQSNRNLLLSESAEVDTKPELEIYADDVKCSHGATVGQLDTTALFYLRSRGLDVESAKHMLTFAFLREVIRSAGDKALSRKMERMLIGSLPEFGELESLL